MKNLSFVVCFLVSAAFAAPVEMPWQQEVSNTSSGYTDQEAAGKVRYYLRKELEDWKGLCEVGQGNFREEFSKIHCEEFYSECWECTGSATAYCDL
jgi:hypothetical protein